MRQRTPEQIAEFAPACDATDFDLEIYRAVGVFVVRCAFPEAMVSAWQAEWREFQTSRLAARRVGFNKVAVEESLPPVLEALCESPVHLDIARRIFGEDVGLYNHRFVIKDEFARDPVFLHQDYCYHFGFPEKASFFTPLSHCGRENGGLEFFLGTHQYGYLGDAGEIDPDAFPEWPSILPELAPGDLVVMNSSTWHRSGPHLGGPDRIVADTILQPAHDPSTLRLLCGTQGPVNRIDRCGDISVFRRSRTSRMKELTAELAALRRT